MIEFLFEMVIMAVEKQYKAWADLSSFSARKHWYAINKTKIESDQHGTKIENEVEWRQKSVGAPPDLV